MRVKRVGIGSAAKLSGSIYGAMGLFFGFVFALLSLFGAGLAQLGEASGDTPPAFIAAMFGVGAIIFLPVLYGVLGLVVGALSAAFYNFFARLVGGLEVELE
jgi:hypothetical protein